MKIDRKWEMITYSQEECVALPERDVPNNTPVNGQTRSIDINAESVLTNGVSVQFL